MEVKNILVPVDGSKHSDKAVKLAADMASKYGAKLTLLQVLLAGRLPDDIRKLSDKPSRPEPGMAVGAGYVDPSEPVEVLEEIADKLLAKAVESAKAEGAKDVDTVKTGGIAAEEILDHADKTNADLIVMGSRGLGGLKGLLAGSVSYKVQNLAKCSVITVK